MRTKVQTLALLSGLRIQPCCKLWCVGLRHGLDPMLLWLWYSPGGYSSNSTPSLGTSICLRCGPKNTRVCTHTQAKCNNKLGAGKGSDLGNQEIEFLFLTWPSAGCVTSDQEPPLSGPHFFRWHWQSCERLSSAII